MEEKYIPLHHLPLGRIGTVIKLASGGTNRRRMLDLGLITGTEVEALQRSPLGDPIAYQIRGAVIALRSEEASQIIVQTN